MEIYFAIPPWTHATTHSRLANLIRGSSGNRADDGPRGISYLIDQLNDSLPNWRGRAVVLISPISHDEVPRYHPTYVPDFLCRLLAFPFRFSAQT